MSPVIQARVPELYNEGNYSNAATYALAGFFVGLLGTLFFIVSTSLCNDLTMSVVFTYALPIVFTFILGVVFRDEEFNFYRILGVLHVLLGLYFI
tara:strand:+ start:11438 stop:11722 length:285 start_codon:yes stop_codon:yes gene_type:complete